MTPVTGTVAVGTLVHPLVLELDSTAGVYTVYTDQERLSVVWAPTMGIGPALIVGNAIIGAGEFRYLFGAMWEGAAAQVGDAEVKLLLTRLGWTVTGY